MQFVSLAIAQNVELLFNNNNVEINAQEPGLIEFNADIVEEEYTVFFESPIAAFDKCAVKITEKSQQSVQLVGLLSKRSEGQVTEELKTKICSKSKGEVHTTTPASVEVVRNFVASKRTCTSKGDPHISSFTGVSYNHMGAGDFWLIKDDYFDIQVHTENCYDGVVTCNKQVAIRYLDNLWVSTLDNPQFVCHSTNQCTDMYSVDNKFSTDGSAIMTLPGNVKIVTTKMDDTYFDINIEAPGPDTDKYQSSVCNPAEGQADVTDNADNTYRVDATDPLAKYFTPEQVALQKPSETHSKYGFYSCELPVSCDLVYPPEGTVLEKECDGKTPTEGFEHTPHGTYTVPNETEHPEHIPTGLDSEKAMHYCKSVLPVIRMEWVGMNIEKYISDCAADLMNGGKGQQNRILQATLQSSYVELSALLDDCIVNIPEKKETCIKYQKMYHFGKNQCPKGDNGQVCSGNGVCNAYGCRCKPKFGGSRCQWVISNSEYGVKHQNEFTITQTTVSTASL